MRKNDVICPDCNAGFRRIELLSRRSEQGEYRCPICDTLLEVFDGSTEVAYRLTVSPARTLRARKHTRSSIGSFALR